jgi:hypothetical protein
LFFSGLPSADVAHDRYNRDGVDEYYSDDYYSSDDDYLSENEKVVHTTPVFISTSTNQLVNEGDPIKLPCLVDKLGKFHCIHVLRVNVRGGGCHTKIYNTLNTFLKKFKKFLQKSKKNSKN